MCILPPMRLRASLIVRTRLAALFLLAFGPLPVLAQAPGAAVGPSPDARLAEIRAEVMRVAPSPRLLDRIPEIESLARAFEQRRDPGKAGAALNAAAVYALLAGDLSRGIRIADRAAALCSAADDRRCFGNAMNQSGIALWRQNDPYGAMQRLQRGARAFDAVGDMERAAIARLNAANIRYDIGDLPGALADYDVIERAYGDDPRWDPVGLLNSKAEVLIKLGRIDEARSASRRAVRMLRERQRSKGTRWESDVADYTLTTLALVEASLGNAAIALPLYRNYLASAARSGSRLERYNANYAYAEGLMTLGRPRDAYGPMNVALSLISETEPADRRDAYDLASRIAAAVDRPTEALAYLRRAEKVRNELAAGTLRSAINDAKAQTAVAEREAQVARRGAELKVQRTRLLAWTMVGVLCLIVVGVALLARSRAQGIEQRFAAVLRERNRMARELHDTLLQGFTGITMQLRAASKSDPSKVNTVLSAMADEAGRWLSETRHAVWDMRAATGGDELRLGLEQAVATARKQTDAEVVLAYDVATTPNATTTGALLRLAQEALSNAGRHAYARRIAVSVRSAGDRVSLSVHDDGIGFVSSPELSALGGHWGLLGMRERVELLRGELRVESAPGKGTHIIAELPL